MSKLSYLHKIMNQSLKDGVVSSYEEQIIEGPKGIFIKYFNKTGQNSEKIKIMGKGDKFEIIIQENDKKEKKILTKDEFIAEIKKNKKLKFAVEFTKTQKGGAWLNRPTKKTKSKSKSKSKSMARPKKASSKKASSKKASTNNKSKVAKKVRRVKK